MAGYPQKFARGGHTRRLAGDPAIRNFAELLKDVKKVFLVDGHTNLFSGHVAPHGIYFRWIAGYWQAVVGTTRWAFGSFRTRSTAYTN